MTTPLPPLPAGIIVVLRTADPEQAYQAALGLIDGGVRTIEITFTIPSAVEVIARLADSDVHLGAGTVLSPDQATAAVTAGARFVVAPDTNADVLRRTHELGVPVVPGALTPTEVQRARLLGADAVKIFPVRAMGGPSYIADLRGPLPDIPFVISGGVTAEIAPRYLELGVQAVCLGREFLDPDEVAAGDRSAIARRARDVLATIGHPS